MTSPTPPIVPSGPLSGSDVAYVIDATEDVLMQVLGDFLTAILGIEVSQGQLNRVPEPRGPNFIIMTPSRRVILATTTHSEIDDELEQAVTRQRSTRADVQLDFYGPQSADNAQVFTTLFRDDYGCEAMEGTGVQPLYCDDGHQMPLVNGEFQYEARWTVSASLQINPLVSTPAQFADTLTPILVEVA